MNVENKQNKEIFSSATNTNTHSSILITSLKDNTQRDVRRTSEYHYHRCKATITTSCGLTLQGIAAVLFPGIDVEEFITIVVAP